MAGRVIELVDVGSSGGGQLNALRPDALRHLGEWTDARDAIVLSLTRTREIVIQQGGIMRYVFRSGRWKALPLQVALDSSWSAGSGVSKDLKRAVLASSIDASLAHHGACIAVVTRGHAARFDSSLIVRANDRWPKNVRSRFLGRETFQRMSRRQRLEMLSMDGATVLNHTGTVLAAGAIVAVPGGSAGGGRLAATRALARYGASLKISQDGPVRMFGLDANGEVVERMAFA